MMLLLLLLLFSGIRLGLTNLVFNVFLSRSSLPPIAYSFAFSISLYLCFSSFRQTRRFSAARGAHHSASVINYTYGPPHLHPSAHPFIPPPVRRIGIHTHTHTGHCYEVSDFLRLCVCRARRLRDDRIGEEKKRTIIINSP